jgi:hypothetical protein
MEEFVSEITKFILEKVKNGVDSFKLSAEVQSEILKMYKKFKMVSNSKSVFEFNLEILEKVQNFEIKESSKTHDTIRITKTGSNLKLSGGASRNS